MTPQDHVRRANDLETKLRGCIRVYVIFVTGRRGDNATERFPEHQSMRESVRYALSCFSRNDRSTWADLNTNRPILCGRVDRQSARITAVANVIARARLKSYNGRTRKK